MRSDAMPTKLTYISQQFSCHVLQGDPQQQLLSVHMNENVSSAFCLLPHNVMVFVERYFLERCWENVCLESVTFSFCMCYCVPV